MRWIGRRGRRAVGEGVGRHRGGSLGPSWRRYLYCRRDGEACGEGGVNGRGGEGRVEAPAWGAAGGNGRGCLGMSVTWRRQTVRACRQELGRLGRQGRIEGV